MTEDTSQSHQQMAPFSLRDHIRLRPSMYFGNVDQWALHEILFAVLDDSIEEVLLGQCEHIWVTLHLNNTVTVRDDGRGIPVHFEKDGRRFLEHVMIDCAHRIQGDYEIRHGLHDMGSLTPMNVLSAECVVEVARDECLWRQSYREGIPQTEVVQVRKLDEDESTGTSITFRPDFTILEPNSFSYAGVAERMRELAYLLPGLTMIVRDEREEIAKQEKFCFMNGLSDYIYDLNQAASPLHAARYSRCEWTISANGKSEYTISVDVVLQYTNAMETKIVGYVNTARTANGLHMDIVPFALAQEINPYRGLEKVDEPFANHEILPGLTAIIVVKHPNPFTPMAEIPIFLVPMPQASLLKLFLMHFADISK